jgi:glutamyl-tRNA synthetase
MTSTEKPRVRFAPSPTGFLHVGGARTALFNWLFAKHEGGTLLLRIEDTDVERNKPELVDGILVALRWLGIEWDEGPFFQSQRIEMYRAAAERVLASGAGYACYCKPAAYTGGDAAEEREGEGDDEGKATKAVACPCRDLTPEQRAAKEKEGIPAAIRFRTPRTGTTHFEDAVFGPRDVQNAEIEDFVLLRSSGLPTYQLSVVVDDIDMRITHVIRGADHLSNTPKQVLIYGPLGPSRPYLLTFR